MKMSQLSVVKQRLLMGTGTIIVVLISIFFSTSPFFLPLFPLLTAAFISTAVWEYFQMVFHKGYTPLARLSIVSTAIYTLAVFFSTQTPHAKVLPQIILLLILASSFLYYFYKGRDPLINISLSLFPIGYLAIPLSCILSINYFHFPEGYAHGGRIWLLYVIATTKMTDIGGYFCGKQFGKRLLSPMISPKKTWEGAIGGLLFALLTSYLFSFLLDIYPITGLLLGLAIAVLAQFGDLAESLLKRDTGIKDSSQMPGLGGSMDIVDSLVFTLPFVYIYLLLTHSIN